MTTIRQFDKSLFRHSVEIRVRNYEVDWQGIVHNAVYLQYFEVGRVEYLKNIGATLDLNKVRGENKVVLVRNEIDYLRPVTFDDRLIVHTRISVIKNTSFQMEGLLVRSGTHELVATNVAHHVWLNPGSSMPIRVPDSFRKQVQAHEGDHCVISWSVTDV